MGGAKKPDRNKSDKKKLPTSSEKTLLHRHMTNKFGPFKEGEEVGRKLPKKNRHVAEKREDEKGSGM